jgi:hypothetical protein
MINELRVNVVDKQYSHAHTVIRSYSDMLPYTTMIDLLAGEWRRRDRKRRV